MKVGVFAVLFGNKPFAEMLPFVKRAGCDAVEIGTGNYPGNAHCPLDELVANEAKARAWAQQVADAGLEISALSCHGNPLHPDAAFRTHDRETFLKTIDLAAMIGVKTVNNFSGCPGDAPGARYPNWVTCAWPPDFSSILAYQWQDEAIPYWTEMHAYLQARGVRVGLELHPGFLVYNPETALRLRAACGDTIGVNFDPSHLFWQGIDPVYAIRALGKVGAIHHVHAKDCRLDEFNTKTYGVLDTRPYTDEANRSWIFRTVGYGHAADVWKDLISQLRLVGYDGALSIEHEDSLMSGDEGFRKAIWFLNTCIIAEPAGTAYWA
jgi:sugar phosphate isomerase/epimerase